MVEKRARLQGKKRLKGSMKQEEKEEEQEDTNARQAKKPKQVNTYIHIETIDRTVSFFS